LLGAVHELLDVRWAAAREPIRVRQNHERLRVARQVGDDALIERNDDFRNVAIRLRRRFELLRGRAFGDRLELVEQHPQVAGPLVVRDHGGELPRRIVKGRRGYGRGTHAGKLGTRHELRSAVQFEERVCGGLVRSSPSQGCAKLEKWRYSWRPPARPRRRPSGQHVGSFRSLAAERPCPDVEPRRSASIVGSACGVRALTVPTAEHASRRILFIPSYIAFHRTHGFVRERSLRA